MKRNRIFFSFFLLLLLGAGCSKHSSPGKVKRLISKGQWEISSIFINSQDITPEFEGVEFIFRDNGNIDITGSTGITGRWSTSAESNPTRLELVVTPIYPFYELNADWTFTTCTKDQMEVEVNTGSVVNSMILRKVGM